MKIFSLSEDSRYDTSSYIGRFQHFQDLFSVTRCMISESQLQTHRDMLAHFQSSPDKFDLADDKVNSQLWEASYAVRSCYNEAKGEVLPFYARLSSFVPMNVPLNLMLCVLPATQFNIILANTTNQSYNALINYRNGSGKNTDKSFLLKSYILALVCSVGGGLLLKKKLSVNGELSMIKEGFVRLFPSCIAGFSNLLIMRSDYYIKGIDVKDENGKVVGQSRYAGIKAVLEGGATRFLFPVPSFIQVFLNRICRERGMTGGKMRAVELFGSVVAIYLCLPFGLALFNNVRPIQVSSMEKEFHGLGLNRNLYYVKGF